MVKVVMLTEQTDPVVLECKDIYHACSVMHTLENSVVGCCAFTVRFVKEEPVKSRFKDITEIPFEELLNGEKIL